jgi:acetoacetate decarboxylase
MAELKGFLTPRSPEGRASIVPAPPWHYSGDVLTIEYRTDPDRVAALLPGGIEPAEEDPGAVALVWADWQSMSEGGQELLDPIRSQYKECFAVVRCRYDGETYSRCVFIWVDKDFALARGWHQGYPKKLGSIWMTRPVTVGRAGPRLDAGGTFGATLQANDRWLPSIEKDGGDSLAELVTMRSRDVELGAAYTGTADVRLFEAPGEELAALEPKEMIAGYWRQVGATFDGGKRFA